MRAITCQSLEMVGLMKPFDLDIFYGERVAVLGSNGSGKSQFLRLLAGDPTVESRGSWKLGARVVPGYFVQTHHHLELLGRTPHEILERDRGETMSALRRYELHRQADQPFETLSGGAEALQDSLAGYQGTVLCVTHDRWFARSFDRFLVFGHDGGVYEHLEPVWDEYRVVRLR